MNIRNERCYASCILLLLVIYYYLATILATIFGLVNLLIS